MKTLPNFKQYLIIYYLFQCSAPPETTQKALLLVPRGPVQPAAPLRK